MKFLGGVGAILAIVPAAIAVFVGIFIAFKVFDPPGTRGVQRGYRGTGLVYLYEPQKAARVAELNAIPASIPYAGNEGPKVSTVYKNVKVLGDVSVGEFTRLMVSMARWVAPQQGCAACHNLQDFADDSLYTKVVARRMLEMTRHINTDWTKHVGDTGVTCYTCHRGQLVPPNIWFRNSAPRNSVDGFTQMSAGKNHPSDAAAGSALPFDPFTPFLEQDKSIRVSSTTPLRKDDRHSIKEAEWTYSLMLVFSKSLGVNCDYCHNTRSFYSWSVSPPQRVTAWHGIRMVRDLNKDYLNPLRETLPQNRLGPVLADPPKIYCATCHNGLYKPLLGVSMLKDYPELKGPSAQKSATTE